MIKSKGGIGLLFLLLVAGFFPGETSPLYGEITGGTAPVSASPFQGFWQNTLDSHSGNYLYLHGTAVAATGLMAFPANSIDGRVHQAPKNIQGVGTELALLAGMVWHIGPAAGVYWGSAPQSKARYASGAVIQAVGISFMVTSAQKYVTGRRGPRESHASTGGLEAPFKRTDDPRDFNFKVWQNFDFTEGRFFWPSGHTATAVAVAAALGAFYEPAWVSWSAYGAAAWMGWSMVDGSHHWASDVVAGFLIGIAIGRTVGLDFRSRYQMKSNPSGGEPGGSKTTRLFLEPDWRGGGPGLRFRWIF